MISETLRRTVGLPSSCRTHSALLCIPWRSANSRRISDRQTGLTFAAKLRPMDSAKSLPDLMASGQRLLRSLGLSRHPVPDVRSDFINPSRHVHTGAAIVHVRKRSSISTDCPAVNLAFVIRGKKSIGRFRCESWSIEFVQMRSTVEIDFVPRVAGGSSRKPSAQ